MSATKYKVGDKVLIREDLKENCRYGEYNFNEYMLKFCGKVLTIEKAYPDCYIVVESHYLFNDEMIAGKVVDDKMDFTKADLKTGMIVTFENGTEGVVFFNNCFTINNEDIIAYICEDTEKMKFCGYDKLSVWTDDLKHNGYKPDSLYNIKKVELPSKYDNFILGDMFTNCKRYVVWERDNKLKQAKQLLAEYYDKPIEDVIVAVK